MDERRLIQVIERVKENHLEMWSYNSQFKSSDDPQIAEIMAIRCIVYDIIHDLIFELECAIKGVES